MAKTRNFAQVIRKKLANDPDLAAAVELESFNSEIAAEIYEARTEAGITQKQLADRVGTHQSVIARLEAADYDGHSLAMLKRLATALGKRLRVGFFSEFQVPLESTSIETQPQWTAPGEWNLEFTTEASVTARQHG